MTIKKGYTDLVPGEWTQPIRRGFRLGCCDCGLVHRMNFRLSKDKSGRNFIEFNVFRDERATAAVRRGPYDYVRKKKR